MELDQTKELLHNKGNNQHSEKATDRMGETAANCTPGIYHLAVVGVASSPGQFCIRDLHMFFQPLQGFCDLSRIPCFD